MSIKTKKQALDSIHQRSKVVAGKSYDSWVCYIGTDPYSHTKILFEKATKAACENAVLDFYQTFNRGTSAHAARNMSDIDCAEFMLAKRRLSDAGIKCSFVEVVEFYIRMVGGIHDCMIGEAYDRYYAQFDELQVEQRRTVKQRVLAFVNSIGPRRLVSSITPQEVSAYLSDKLGQLAPKTYNGALTYISSFFAWCCRKDIAIRLDNPADTIRKKTIAYEEPEYIMAPALRRIFETLTAQTEDKRRNHRIAFAALAFFNGVRTAELLRLHFRDLNVEEGWIRIAKPKGFQHGIRPRVAPLTDAAKAWLSAYPVESLDQNAKIFPNFRHGNIWRPVVSKHAPDLEVPDNAARHSFVTMHVAMFGDPAKTEAIVGTSTDMRVKHYMGLATKKQAETYFGVMPA